MPSTHATPVRRLVPPPAGTYLTVDVDPSHLKITPWLITGLDLVSRVSTVGALVQGRRRMAAAAVALGAALISEVRSS